MKCFLIKTSHKTIINGYIILIDSRYLKVIESNPILTKWIYPAGKQNNRLIDEIKIENSVYIYIYI